MRNYDHGPVELPTKTVHNKNKNIKKHKIKYFFFFFFLGGWKKKKKKKKKKKLPNKQISPSLE